MMQVSEVMADNDADVPMQSGKKNREERELQLNVQAENEKLLDKDWKECTFPVCCVDGSVVEEMAG